MRTELAEAKRQVAVLVQNKEKVEREMRQAFLRSVCKCSTMPTMNYGLSKITIAALNLEAMSMFSSTDAVPTQGEDIEPRMQIPKPISNNEDSRDL